MMTEKSKKVLEYLRTVNGQNVTAADVAEALGMEKRTVDGTFTSGIQRKGLGSRVEAEVELPDGSHRAVKLLVLNEKGLTIDPDADEE